MPRDDDPAEPSDWSRYLTSIVRHKWAVLVVTVVGAVLGVAATRILNPQYTARTILYIEASGRPADRDLISGEEVVEAAGWSELVTSNTVLDSVVRGLRLYLTPGAPEDSALFSGLRLGRAAVPGRYELAVDRDGRSFALLYEDDIPVQQGTLGDSIGTSVGFAWAPGPGALPPGRKIQFSVTTPHDAARQLARSLRVRLDAAGSFLRLELKGPDPDHTERVLDAITRQVVLVAADLKRQKYQELARILGEQYEFASRNLRSAEAALAQFQVRAAGEMRDGMPAITPGLDVRGDPAFAEAFELRVSLDQQRRDREAIEGVLSAVPEHGLRREALAVIGSVQQSPQLSRALEEATEKNAELRALRYRYTDESAPVQQLRADLETLERRTIPALARQLASELAARESATAPRVDRAYGQLRALPPLAVQQARLQREVASADQIFSTIHQRYEAARLALVSSLPDLRVLDRATAGRRPAAGLGPLLIALSILTTFGFAVMGVTLWDRADSKVRYPDQVTRGMQLPILGALPHVSWRLRGNGSSEMEVIEALRGLRLRVLHAVGQNGPLLITVTSPCAGDGKSFVSANLALSFAHAGYRTLLVDGDVRRGAQHHAVASPLQPGLTDVLAGKCPPESALRTTGFDGLDLLSSGSRMHRAPELLLTGGLSELIERLGRSYGVVIVDSPPLAVGSDPMILATATGKVLVVLRAGTTDLAFTTSRLDALAAMPVRTIGAVLNDVRGGDPFQYYRYTLKDYVIPDPERAGIIGGRT